METPAKPCPCPHKINSRGMTTRSHICTSLGLLLPSCCSVLDYCAPRRNSLSGECFLAQSKNKHYTRTRFPETAEKMNESSSKRTTEVAQRTMPLFKCLSPRVTGQVPY